MSITNNTHGVKCLYSGFFWSVLSRIRTEYGEIIFTSPYSDRMRENTDQKTFEYEHFSSSDTTWDITKNVYILKGLFVAPSNKNLNLNSTFWMVWVCNKKFFANIYLKLFLLLFILKDNLRHRVNGIFYIFYLCKKMFHFWEI